MSAHWWIGLAHSPCLYGKGISCDLGSLIKHSLFKQHSLHSSVRKKTNFLLSHCAFRSELIMMLVICFLCFDILFCLYFQGPIGTNSLTNEEVGIKLVWSFLYLKSHWKRELWASKPNRYQTPNILPLAFFIQFICISYLLHSYVGGTTSKLSSCSLFPLSCICLRFISQNSFNRSCVKHLLAQVF